MMCSISDVFFFGVWKVQNKSPHEVCSFCWVAITSRCSQLIERVDVRVYTHAVIFKSVKQETSLLLSPLVSLWICLPCFLAFHGLPLPKCSNWFLPVTIHLLNHSALLCECIGFKDCWSMNPSGDQKSLVS